MKLPPQLVFTNHTSILFLFFMVRNNSRGIKCAHIKCSSQWIFKYVQLCTIPVQNKHHTTFLEGASCSYHPLNVTPILAPGHHRLILSGCEIRYCVLSFLFFHPTYIPTLLPVASNGLFLLIVILLYYYNIVLLFIFSTGDGHLSCFQFKLI